MAKRGRPTKAEKEYKGKSYGYMNNPKAEQKNGLLSRAIMKNKDFKFQSYEYLKKAIFSYLEWGTKNCPFGIIMKNCEPYREAEIESYIYGSRYNMVIRELLAQKLTELFTNAKDDYIKTFKTDVKNIAYKLTIELDMRQYGNNLSVIYQIINDIHYNFFNAHLACYILNGQPDLSNPYYTITIFVSNVGIGQKCYLSTTMAYDFDNMKQGVKTIINKDINFFTNKGKSDFHVAPLFITENPTNEVKPDNMYYIDWYKSIYGSSFISNPNTNNVLTKLK